MQYQFNLKHMLENFQCVSINILQGYFHQPDKHRLIEVRDTIDELENAINQLKQEVITFRMTSNKLAHANITISAYTLEQRCRHLIDVGNKVEEVLDVLLEVIKQLSTHRNKKIEGTDPIESVKQKKDFSKPLSDIVEHDSQREVSAVDKTKKVEETPSVLNTVDPNKHFDLYPCTTISYEEIKIVERLFNENVVEYAETHSDSPFSLAELSEEFIVFDKPLPIALLTRLILENVTKRLRFNVYKKGKDDFLLLAKGYTPDYKLSTDVLLPRLEEGIVYTDWVALRIQDEEGLTVKHIYVKFFGKRDEDGRLTSVLGYIPVEAPPCLDGFLVDVNLLTENLIEKCERLYAKVNKDETTTHRSRVDVI